MDVECETNHRKQNKLLQYLSSEVTSEISREMLFLVSCTSCFAEELELRHPQLPVALLEHIRVTLPVLEV